MVNREGSEGMEFGETVPTQAVRLVPDGGSYLVRWFPLSGTGVKQAVVAQFLPTTNQLLSGETT